MSGGGKSGGSQVVGYDYYLGVQLIPCHGPVDAVTRIIVGERDAWSGSVTSSGDISINQPDLFGGKSREGGLVGTVSIRMGNSTQAQDSYLVSNCSAHVPAYIGVLSLIFKSFLWASMNPYFKAPWIEVRRILAGWSRDTVWYSAKAQIGSYDMNPAHIIYQCLTDFRWGMGYTATDIDDTSFMACADQLYDEGFGLSLMWDQQMAIQEFVQTILNHINGSLRLDLRLGKFVLKLIRDDYTIGELIELNPDNVLQMSSFQRVGWGESANEITVKYTDRAQEEQTVTVQDLASIEIQGAVISTTKEYLGIRDQALAIRVAMRDLATSSSALAKVTLVTNRVMWDKEVGDVFAFTWPELGITGAPFRIAKINKGSLINGEIHVEAVEDVFGLPTDAYAGTSGSGWIDPVQPPVAVTAAKALEAPYWDVVKSMSAADLDYLTPGYAFGQVAAVRPTSDSFSFELQSSPTNTVYSFAGNGPFCPSGTLATDISYTTGTVVLNNARDLDLITVGNYAIIDIEYVKVTAVVVSTRTISFERGVLDSVPVPHSTGARMYFSGQYYGYDRTQHSIGVTEYYKPLTKNGRGVLPLSSATALQVDFFGRAEKPYPPGQWKINGSYWPTDVIGDLTLTWAHRDRLSQTVDLIPYTTGNIGPEAGTTYRVMIYNGTTHIRDYAGITGTSWIYPNADAIADGCIQTIRLITRSEVGGNESWQEPDYTVVRHGYGFHYGEDYGGI